MQADALKRLGRELITDSENSGSTASTRAGALTLSSPSPSRPPGHRLGDDWVGEALLTRAWNNEATIRERSTAAMGLWQRAMGQGRAERNRPGRTCAS